MNNQNYLEAIEAVLAWDLPDEVFADAINDQFRLMDGLILSIHGIVVRTASQFFNTSFFIPS